MGFRTVYKQGRGGGGAGELIPVLKSVLKTSYMEVLIKILFEFDRFFQFQNVVKMSNSFQY